MKTLDPTKIDEMVSSMSLEEKTRLLTGKTAWKTYAVPAVGLKEMAFSDGPVGVRGIGEREGEVSDCLPSPTALAACWDVDLARRVGRWFAGQAREHGVDVVLAPVINLQRSPVGGRHFECYSEDPTLIADISEAWVVGLQSEGVAACVKHFIGNEVETDRTAYISRIAPRPLREVYMAPFERVVNAGAWSIMAAYNRTDTGIENSTMVAHHQLLAEVLKQEWGFDGPVVSDWTATRDLIPPALGGLDLVMPGPQSPWSDGALLEAVRRGDVPEELIDDKVRRLLWLAQKVGALAGYEQNSTQVSGVIDEDLPRELAARAAVVLTDRQHSLPLSDPASIRSIVLIGPNAVDTRLLGGGSASVALSHRIGLADGLTQVFPDASVDVIQGVDSRLNPPTLEIARTHVPGGTLPGVNVQFLAQDGWVIKDCVYETWTGEFRDDMPQDTATVHIATVAKLTEPGTHWLGIGTVGAHRILIDGTLISSSDREVGGEVVINSSFNVPPAYGIDIPVEQPRDVTMEAWLQYIPTQWGGIATGQLHHKLPSLTGDEAIAEAVEAAVAADLAIVVVGTNEETESEGWDRTSLDLPGRQNDLVDAVLAQRPDAIILVNAGAPVILPWIDRAQTVIWFWFPGQDAGLSLADILTGKTEPSGRLPWTLPARHEDCPVPWGLPDDDGVIDYTEGLNVGYRGWAKLGHHPARPFGFGLGWTTWDMGQCEVIAQHEEGIDLKVRTRNTGSRQGTDIVQVYLSAEDRPDIDRPVLWLGGHTTLHANPGETSEAIVHIPRRQFETWVPDSDGNHGRWELVPGVYSLAIGHNAEDLSARVSVEWKEVAPA